VHIHCEMRDGAWKIFHTEANRQLSPSESAWRDVMHEVLELSGIVSMLEPTGARHVNNARMLPLSLPIIQSVAP